MVTKDTREPESNLVLLSVVITNDERAKISQASNPVSHGLSDVHHLTVCLR